MKLSVSSRFVLGSLLFLFFINDPPVYLSNIAKSVLYADGTTVFINEKSLELGWSIHKKTV